MDLVKSHWQADSDRVRLSMPISKIDTEHRLVSGFATLDNVDTSDDVVTAEASKGAFERFRGNIREMHQPIAAGRLVDFQEDEFYHDGTFYRGIYATAYVSKGAEDTWQKVLDGTLSGFSIGGNIIEQETKFVKDAGPNGKTIRYIEKYDLIELSLVDNPANQLANLDSVVKVFTIKEDSHGDMVMKGMAVETTVVNVFWCASDEIAKNSTNESETCLSCGKSMQQIGWFEKGEDEAVKTAAAVADFLRQKEVNADNTKQTGEGGVNMADNIEKSDEVVTSDNTSPVAGNVEERDNARAVAEREAEANGEVLSSEEADKVEAVPTTEELDNADASEDEDKDAAEAEGDEADKADDAADDNDLEKMFDDLKKSVKESVETTVASIEEKFDSKASELEKSLNELSESLEAIKTERGEVAKRLDALEKVSAIKKSGEVETTEPVTKAKKGLWSGTFFDGE